jgi:hypothetical protein
MGCCFNKRYHDLKNSFGLFDHNVGLFQQPIFEAMFRNPVWLDGTDKTFFCRLLSTIRFIASSAVYTNQQGTVRQSCIMLHRVLYQQLQRQWWQQEIIIVFVNGYLQFNATTEAHLQ